MKRIWLYGAGLLLWLIGLISLLSPRLAWTELSYRLPELHELYFQKREENGLLRERQAQLCSIERIEKIARQELGMVFPQAGQVVRMGRE